MALDFFKNISSKLTVNSLLKIDMMMILGAYRFAVKNSAYQTLKRQSEYKWQEVNRLGSNPALQFTGFGVETIDLEGIIYPHFKGGLKQITLMRSQAGLGKPLFLISGNGFAFGRWCISKILSLLSSRISALSETRPVSSVIFKDTNLGNKVSVISLSSVLTLNIGFMSRALLFQILFEWLFLVR